MKITKGMSLATNARRYTRKTVAGLLSVVFFAACCPIAFAAEDSNVPLTPDELAGMTHEEVATISKEQSDATLNKMAQLFQDGEKQGLDEYLAALGFATTYEEYEAQKEEEWLEEQANLEPSIQPLWQSDYDDNEPEKQCHEQLTASGFLAYIMANNLLFGGGESGYRLEDLTLLANESAQPDADPASVATMFSGHFYDPDTGLNFLLNRSNTALTNAEYYYNKAIDEYNSGDRTAAITSLSHSLHYVQDVSVPHHAANKVALLSNHTDYEELASQMILDGEMSFDLESTDYFTVEFYNNCYANTISNLVHKAAVFSKQYIDVATDEENIVGQKLVIAATTGMCIIDTSAVLYKFAKEIGAT